MRALAYPALGIYSRILEGLFSDSTPCYLERTAPDELAYRSHHAPARGGPAAGDSYQPDHDRSAPHLAGPPFLDRGTGAVAGGAFEQQTAGEQLRREIYGAAPGGLRDGQVGFRRGVRARERVRYESPVEGERARAASFCVSNTPSHSAGCAAVDVGDADRSPSPATEGSVSGEWTSTDWKLRRRPDSGCTPSARRPRRARPSIRGSRWAATGSCECSPLSELPTSAARSASSGRSFGLLGGERHPRGWPAVLGCGSYPGFAAWFARQPRARWVARRDRLVAVSRLPTALW